VDVAGRVAGMDRTVQFANLPQASSTVRRGAPRFSVGDEVRERTRFGERLMCG